MDNVEQKYGMCWHPCDRLFTIISNTHSIDVPTTGTNDGVIFEQLFDAYQRLMSASGKRVSLGVFAGVFLKRSLNDLTFAELDDDCYLSSYNCEVGQFYTSDQPIPLGTIR